MNGLAITKLANIFLACLIAVMFVVAPTMVLAGQDDNPNYGYCKSGELVSNIKYCRKMAANFKPLRLVGAHDPLHHATKAARSYTSRRNGAA